MYGHEDVLGFARRMMAFDGQEIRAINALEYINSTPDTLDMQNSWRQMLMRGVQQALSKVGYRVSKGGIADPVTAQALVSLAGPRWRTQSWLQIYRKLQSLNIR